MKNDGLGFISLFFQLLATVLMSLKKLFAEVIRALLFVSRRIYELEMMVRIPTSHKHSPRALASTMFHLRGDEAHGQTNPGVIAQIRLRPVNQADSADADIRRVRLRADRPNEGVAFVMIGASESLKILTTKTIAFNRRNRKRGLSFGDGALVCMEWPGGQLRAVIAARSFTALRTATCSALATSHLASSGPHRALFIGAGSQARAHLGALITVSELEAITVCGRSHQGVQGFLDYAQRLVPGRARAGSRVQEEVSDATLIVAATSSSRPVVKGEWLRPGQHVVSVAALGPQDAELDSDALQTGTVIVDTLGEEIDDTGEFVALERQGISSRALIRGDLAALVRGEVHGRTDVDEITVYKSMGSGEQDLIAASYVLSKAAESGRP